MLILLPPPLLVPPSPLLVTPLPLLGLLLLPLLLFLLSLWCPRWELVLWLSWLLTGGASSCEFMELFLLLLLLLLGAEVLLCGVAKPPVPSPRPAAAAACRRPVPAGACAPGGMGTASGREVVADPMSLPLTEALTGMLLWLAASGNWGDLRNAPSTAAAAPPAVPPPGAP